MSNAGKPDPEGGIGKAQAGRRKTGLFRPENVKALLYGFMNVASASMIVFANKAVFQTYDFHFTYALTFIHTVFTLLGMTLFSKYGLFEVKKLPQIKLVQLAGSYVAYIVLCNLSLKVNTVGFYQVMKIAVAPTVIALDLILFGKLPRSRIIASVGVVCMGITIATVSDSQIIKNVIGIFIGMAATLMTALYQIWAGSKQKELKASSMQLLHAYTPQASLMLGLLVPLCENMGWGTHAPGSLLGYKYSPAAVTAILISSVLGLLVSLSTFLVIGATSSLTYNVVGHLKTVIILTGGCLFFGDTMPLRKFLGVCVAMCGIIWYTQLKLAEASGPSSSSSNISSTTANGNVTANGYHSGQSGGLQGPGPKLMEHLTPRSAFTLGLSSRRQTPATSQ